MDFQPELPLICSISQVEQEGDSGEMISLRKRRKDKVSLRVHMPRKVNPDKKWLVLREDLVVLVRIIHKSL